MCDVCMLQNKLGCFLNGTVDVLSQSKCEGKDAHILVMSVVFSSLLLAPR